MSREDQLLYMDASSMKSAKKDMLFYVKESAFLFRFRRNSDVGCKETVFKSKYP